MGEPERYHKLEEFMAMRLEQLRHIVIAGASNVFDFAMSRNVSFRQNFERYEPA